MKYKTVLFDWDGCLLNNLPTWLGIYTNILDKYDIRISNKEIAEKLFGDWNGPLKVGLKENRLKQFNLDLLSLADTILPDSPLHLGARELLSTLIESDVQLGLVSSSKLETVMPILRKHCLYDYFEVIITADMIKEHKPNPESILKAMGRLDSKNNSTLMVGDSEKDILAAHKAEIDSVLFLPGMHNDIYNFEFLKSTKPTYIVKNLTEILELNGKI
ncbi:hypothetical protein COW38_03470 [Candidatus Collierbacteria bacterium CG17_big_fil_post_rev_8_21_14_2_50_45_7]|uniref:HAD family hydrolase n=3 Tax=Microgenomates group TaxID=1794810 RepID=A0A2H0WZQ5_9BACT|nr:MAG: hypothetical protein COT54_00735 [Candidatus Collierbacteria bacterium CG09_land_8_20_14_0_10_46_12]PIV08482.1 MAG: hypothetical protein COS52_02475 [Candidatus Roizmanbacteria bacterium CG03_land_8_20_14_0_80_39_12]PIW07078.1 MAG: hypothetical protein COW38_03470 [Candidatus Collierbacteria bacterium CG17_big_fil_post_rev_8_21_14_2_50_45_7]